MERFSSFLKNVHNGELQKIRFQLTHQLINFGVITRECFSIDSSPIPDLVKENNLKTNLRSRFSKTCIPKGSPDACLGSMVIYLKPNEKQTLCFWSFRDHVVIDAKAELLLWQIIKLANVHEPVIFLPIFKLIQREFHLSIKAVMGDAIYDNREVV